MLTWKETVKAVAYFNGYTYTITQGYDDLDECEVEITDPDGGVVAEVFNTIEEAKEFCENTAAEVQAEE
jgi:viroplasmin and RNaseH domain-containing protein